MKLKIKINVQLRKQIGLKVMFKDSTIISKDAVSEPRDDDDAKQPLYNVYDHAVADTLRITNRERIDACRPKLILTSTRFTVIS